MTVLASRLPQEHGNLFAWGHTFPGISITADKIATILKAAGVSVEPYWPTLFAKALDGVDVGSLLGSLGSAASAAGAGEREWDRDKEGQTDKERKREREKEREKKKERKRERERERVREKIREWEKMREI